MAAYFDVNDEAHLALLPLSARSKVDELGAVAAEVEADVIAHYTRRAPDRRHTSAELTQEGHVLVLDASRESTEVAQGIYVYLDGYAVDATEAEATLATAMRRTIAYLIPHRLHQWRRKKGIASESGGQGQAATTYKDDAEDPLPSGWDRYLRPYVTEEPLWCL